VHRAFDQLSEEHREILALVDIEELTYEEAGAVLDIPIGTVRSRLSRARAALRQHIAYKDGKTGRMISSCVNVRLRATTEASSRPTGGIDWLLCRLEPIPAALRYDKHRENATQWCAPA
jgi:RNA polymerase sigma-70 factor (ECF subfamily)